MLAIPPHCHVGYWYFTRLLSLTLGFVKTFSHTPPPLPHRSRSKCIHSQIPCPGHISFLPFGFGYFTYLLRPKGVSRPWSKVILILQGKCTQLSGQNSLTAVLHLDCCPLAKGASWPWFCHVTTDYCPLPKGVSWPWFKYIFKVKVDYSHNLCPCHNS